MKNIGFGIIGIGRQGLRLAEHIRKDIPHGKLIAVCRRSASGHEYSKEHGIKFYNNHHDLLSDKDEIYVDITAGRKTKALGLLFGSYARINRVKKIMYVKEEDKLMGRVV